MVGRDVEWTERPPDTPPDRYVVIVGAGASGLILGLRLLRLGIPFTILERGRRRRRHVARQHVSRLRRRHPEPRLLVLDRASPRMDPQLLATTRAARLSPPMDRRVRPARTHLLRPLGHGSDVERDDTGVGCRRRDARRTTALHGHRSGCGDRPVRDPVDPRDRRRGRVRRTGCSTPRPGRTSSISTGKRVAIIGTGASAMQIVPTIADDVAQLTIFQRSPQWARSDPALPRPDQRADPVVADQRAVLRRVVPVHDAVALRRRTACRSSDAIPTGHIPNGHSTTSTSAIVRRWSITSRPSSVTAPI